MVHEFDGRFWIFMYISNTSIGTLLKYTENPNTILSTIKRIVQKNTTVDTSNITAWTFDAFGEAFGNDIVQYIDVSSAFKDDSEFTSSLIDKLENMLYIISQDYIIPNLPNSEEDIEDLDDLGLLLFNIKEHPRMSMHRLPKIIKAAIKSVTFSETFAIKRDKLFAAQMQNTANTSITDLGNSTDALNLPQSTAASLAQQQNNLPSTAFRGTDVSTPIVKSATLIGQLLTDVSSKVRSLLKPGITIDDLRRIRARTTLFIEDREEFANSLLDVGIFVQNSTRAFNTVAYYVVKELLKIPIVVSQLEKQSKLRRRGNIKKVIDSALLAISDNIDIQFYSTNKIKLDHLIKNIITDLEARFNNDSGSLFFLAVEIILYLVLHLYAGDNQDEQLRLIKSLMNIVYSSSSSGGLLRTTMGIDRFDKRENNLFVDTNDPEKVVLTKLMVEKQAVRCMLVLAYSNIAINDTSVNSLDTELRRSTSAIHTNTNDIHKLDVSTSDSTVQSTDIAPINVGSGVMDFADEKLIYSQFEALCIRHNLGLPSLLIKNSYDTLKSIFEDRGLLKEFMQLFPSEEVFNTVKASLS